MQLSSKLSGDVKFINDGSNISVAGRFVFENNIPVLSSSGDEIVFIFRNPTYGSWKHIEEFVVEKHYDKHKMQDVHTYNFMLLKAFILRHLLISWSLPIDLSFDGSVLDEFSFNRVLTVHPNILRYFIDKIENMVFLSDEDKNIINKQCLMMFAKNSNGVNAPHEAISMYCTLSGFWDKFGLNYFDLECLPHDIFLKLKTILNNETDIKIKQIKSEANNAKNGKPPKRGGQTLNLGSF